ncbi:tyrosinase family protein [Pseudomonas laurylsulfatiphila]|uniref:tyrosinase family protein n=1 Tax=Pseudomonas laurylsulfatiphila TaxID=2011015 RepID=UPI003D1C9BDA
MDIRRNHRDMTPQQKADFIEAVLSLKNDVGSVLRPGRQSRYDDFVQIHKNSMGAGTPLDPNPHGSPLFYPWHRIFLRQFELAMQAATSNPGITLPYWNWQLGGTDNPFTSHFMGGDGDPAQDARVTFGPFAMANGRFDIRVWDGETGNPGLRRNLAGTAFLPTIEAVTSTLKNPLYQEPTGGWESSSENDLHNPVHSWIGGDMTTASSPNDPMFFLHHCYLDLLWERWRRQHPTTPPYSGRPDMFNELFESTLVFNPDNEPAPWPQHFTVEQTLSTEGLDYRYEYF